MGAGVGGVNGARWGSRCIGASEPGRLVPRRRSERQGLITVTYKGTLVGEYFVDLLVEDAVLIELKTVRALDRAHRAQCINYLRATGRHLCLLVNFGPPRLEFRRVVLDL
jgi:GxxExxY protein